MDHYEFIVSIQNVGLKPVSFRGSVRPFTLSDMNISENSLQTIIKFNLKPHWGGGLLP